jgi:biopolymer transport protein ExbD
MRNIKNLKVLLLFILALSVAAVIFFYWSTTESKPTTFYENLPASKVAKKEDYDNCIVLNRNEAVLIVNNREANLNYTALNTELTIYVDSIKEKEFKIIITADSEYKQLVALLDILAKARVDSYKILKS